MTVNLILFLTLAVVAIAAAIGMLLSRNSVYSALFLIINFGCIALFYLMLNAPFIALAQVTVYAGAIMVLFLFVIMLLGAEQIQAEGVTPWQQPAALLLGLVLLIEGAYVVIFRSGIIPQPQPVPAGFGDPAGVGQTLFSQYLIPFEITSVILLVAMIGAIVLTQRSRKSGEHGKLSEQPEITTHLNVEDTKYASH